MSLETETIEISGLSMDTIRVIDERAELAGKSRAEYAQSVLEREARVPMSMHDLYAPVREQIAASGISDEELDALLDEARTEVWQEKQQRKASRG